MTKILAGLGIIVLTGLCHETSVAESTPKVPPKLQISAIGKLTDPFVADEKGILKVNEIMRKRITDICPESHFSYAVEFSDNSSYKTDSLEPILQEENKTPRKITYISMKAESLRPCNQDNRYKLYGDPSIEVEISNRSFFSGLSYTIAGDKRDWVFLTQSDLSEKLASLGTTYYLSINGWRFLTAVIASIFFYFVAALLGRRGIEKRLKVIEPTSVPITLRKYIFNTDPNLPQLLFVSSLMIGFFVLLLTYPLFDYLLPSAIFLIGDEIKRYEQINYYRSLVISGILGMIFIPTIIDFVKNRLFSRNL